MIENLVNNYHTNLIQIWDDLFTINLPRLIKIKDKLRLGKLVKFNCQPRPNLVTDELCLLLKDLNVTTGIFGFESGCDKVLGYLKRDTVTVEQNKKAIQLFRKHKIGIQGSVVFGSPGETIEDMYTTLDFIDYCYSQGVERLWAFVLTPFPGTELWQDRFSDWDRLAMQDDDNPLLLDKSVDIKEFHKVFRLAQDKIKKFRYRKVGMFIKNSPWDSFKYACQAPLQTMNLLTRRLDV
jgi:anaerobic magnesium-protoporphyrin IX monomethyl ester cyclase